MEGEPTVDVIDDDDVMEKQDVTVHSDNKQEVDNHHAEEGIATTTTTINNTDDSSSTTNSEEYDPQIVKNNGVNETDVTVSVEEDDIRTAAEEEGQHDKENSVIHEDAADNYEDAEQAGKSSNNHLPLSKIKHIMKLDPDVTLCSSDAAFLITRATVSTNTYKLTL